ncbi:hypothetical protein, partial [Micrococcus luteus]|uniref:hypothetical protein n=1 Tax=Micrococcus luteus TaxID=1270 RepID=UPI0020120327
MVMILTVPLGTAYTDHLTRPVVVDGEGPSWDDQLFPPRSKKSDPTMTHNQSALTTLIGEVLA